MIKPIYSAIFISMTNLATNIFLLAANLFLFVGCATTNSTSAALKLIPESDYQMVLESQTQRKQVYSGLYNIMDLTATLLTSKVVEAQTDQFARLYLWDENKYSQEKAKSQEKISKETEVFVSFFTPERKHDDLHKNQTLWKVFMDLSGNGENKRVEGKTKKIKLLTEEIQGFYPYHNRFATPYTITFPIPMKQVESYTDVKLTITGPVGSATVNFKELTH